MPKNLMKGNGQNSKIVEVPDDILLPGNLNAIDQGRRVINPKGNNAQTAVANYAVSLNAVVNKSIEEGRIDVTPDLGDTVVTTSDTQTITGAKTFTAATTTITGALLAGEITADTTSDIGFGDSSAAGNGTLFTVSDVNGRISTTGDVTMFESVVAPATSSSYSIKSKSIVHTCTAAATNVIAINIPVGAKLIGAQILVSTLMVLAGGGATWEATWTAATQTIGGAGQLLVKNTKVKALFDANGASPIVAGAVETITITPNAGTIDIGGVLVVTAWYEELSDLSNVA